LVTLLELHKDAAYKKVSSFFDFFKETKVQLWIIQVNNVVSISLHLHKHT